MNTFFNFAPRIDGLVVRLLTKSTAIQYAGEGIRGKGDPTWTEMRAFDGLSKPVYSAWHPKSHPVSRNETSWRMLAAMAEKVLDLGNETVR